MKMARIIHRICITGARKHSKQIPQPSRQHRSYTYMFVYMFCVRTQHLAVGSWCGGRFQIISAAVRIEWLTSNEWNTHACGEDVAFRKVIFVRESGSSACASNTHLSLYWQPSHQRPFPVEFSLHYVRLAYKIRKERTRTVYLSYYNNQQVRTTMAQRTMNST